MKMERVEEEEKQEKHVDVRHFFQGIGSSLP